jgi:hypothetical protein
MINRLFRERKLLFHSFPSLIYIEQGIRKEIEKNGDGLITVGPAMDVAKQINQTDQSD